MRKLVPFVVALIVAPGPDLARKQAELAKLVSQAIPSTGPMVLEFAVMANSLSNVRRLHEGGEIPPGPWGTLLHIAATYGNPAMLEYLVNEGFGLEDVGEATTIPALGIAVTTGNVENVKWLTANGANVNATNTSGGLVIHHSMVCKDQALVDLLLEAGAVPDSKAREVARRLGMALELD